MKMMSTGISRWGFFFQNFQKFSKISKNFKKLQKIFFQKILKNFKKKISQNNFRK